MLMRSLGVVLVIKDNFSGLKEALYKFFPWLLILLMFQELGENMWRTSGHYHFRRLIYLLAPLLLFLWSTLKHAQTKVIWEKVRDWNWPEQFILFSSCYLSWKMARNPKVTPLGEEGYLFIIESIQWICFGGVLTLTAFYKKIKKNNRDRIFFALIVLLFVNKMLVPSVVPSPNIDVFVTPTLGAEYILEGVNPYSASYPDIYKGQFDYAPGYAYWPGVLVAQVPAFFFFGDIRYGVILFDFLSLIGLFFLLKNLSFKWSVLLLWSFFPAHLFILEQAWIDPILVACFIGTTYFLERKSFIIAGICLGMACATKQYAGVVAIIYGLYIWREDGFLKALILTFSSLLFFSLIMLPFWLWDFEGWKRMTLDVPLSQNMRLDSFSLIAAFQNEFGISIKNYFYSIPPMITFLTLGWMIWQKRIHYLRASFILLMIIFLFGKQAFCNYYYFASIFLVMELGLVPLQRPTTD